MYKTKEKITMQCYRDILDNLACLPDLFNVRLSTMYFTLSTISFFEVSKIKLHTTSYRIAAHSARKVHRSERNIFLLAFVADKETKRARLDLCDRIRLRRRQ